MVTISTAFTTPVNPPNATPILSHDDLWAALVAKARHPEEFVSAIESSRIVKEDQNGLTRAVQFKGDMGKGGEVEEVVKYIGKMKIDFLVPKTGQFVSNIISSSTSNPQDLLLTFTFEFPHPEVSEESIEEVKALEERYAKMGSGVVPHSVDVARKMKEEGRI